MIYHTIVDREDLYGCNAFSCHYGTTYEVSSLVWQDTIYNWVVFVHGLVPINSYHKEFVIWIRCDLCSCSVKPHCLKPLGVKEMTWNYLKSKVRGLNFIAKILQGSWNLVCVMRWNESSEFEIKRCYCRWYFLSDHHCSTGPKHFFVLWWGWYCALVWLTYKSQLQQGRLQARCAHQLPQGFDRISNQSYVAVPA